MKRKLIFCGLIILLAAGELLAAMPLTGPDVALIPLDNRPACLDFTLRIGATAGANVRVPPYRAIGAYSFTGDPDETVRWLASLKPAPRYLIVSMDMLAYGGLVASRTGETSLYDASARIAQLASFKLAHPETRILAFGVIQRIARTSIGDKEYDRITGLISDYVKKADRAEAENNAVLKAQAEDLKSKIPEDQLNSYLNARKRNHEINKQTLKLVSSGVIDYLVLGMDDNGVYGPQRGERDALESEIKRLEIGDRTIIKPGADEVAHLLLARAINDHYGLRPRCAVKYYPADANAWIPQLEDRPLEQQVARSLDIAGFRLVEGKHTDVYLLLFGESPGGGGDEAAAAARLAADAASLQRAGLAAGVADLRRMNQSSAPLVRALLSGADVTRLAAYSGWNTAGNALGTCIGHLAAEHAMRRLDASNAPGARARAAAHLSFLLQRFLEDYIFMATIRDDVYNQLYAKGISAFGIPGKDYEAFEKPLKKRVITASREFFEKYFLGKQYRAGDHTYTIRDMTLSILIPWFRAFEIEVGVAVQISE